MFPPNETQSESDIQQSVSGVNTSVFSDLTERETVINIKSVHFSDEMKDRGADSRRELMAILNSNMHMGLGMFILLILTIWPQVVTGFLATIYFKQQENIARFIGKDINLTDLDNMTKHAITIRNVSSYNIHDVNYTKVSYKKAIEMLKKKTHSFPLCNKSYYLQDKASIIIFDAVSPKDISKLVWKISMGLRSIGYIVSGIAADMYGRKIIFQINALSAILMIFCTAFASSEWFLLLFYGLAIAFSYNSGLMTFILFIETIPFHMRTYMSQIILAGMGVSLICGAFLHTYVLNFKYIFSMYGVFSTVMLFAIWYIPESPRWLLTQRKYKETCHVLNQLKVNIPASLRNHELTPKERSTVLHQLSILTRKRFRRCILFNTFILLVIRITYFNYTIDDEVISAPELLILKGSFILLRPLTATLFLYFFGRRLSLCFICALLGLTNFIALVDKKIEVTVTFLSMVLSTLCVSIALLYTLELYPVVHCGTMMGFINGIASSMVIILIYTENSVTTKSFTFHLFIKMMLNLAAAFVTLYMPETTTNITRFTDIETIYLRNQQNK